MKLKPSAKIRLQHIARNGPRYGPSASVQALAALYIGDGLREIAAAINSAVNPTEADLDKGIAKTEAILKEVKGLFVEEEAQCPIQVRQGTCGGCDHWKLEIATGGQLGYCDLATSPANVAGIAGKCTGFVGREKETS